MGVEIKVASMTSDVFTRNWQGKNEWSTHSLFLPLLWGGAGPRHEQVLMLRWEVAFLKSGPNYLGLVWNEKLSSDNHFG